MDAISRNANSWNQHLASLISQTCLSTKLFERFAEAIFGGKYPGFYNMDEPLSTNQAIPTREKARFAKIWDDSVNATWRGGYVSPL